MPRHKLTTDDRRRGQAKGAKTKRVRREDAEQEARAKLADAVDEAVTTLVAELKAEDATARIRAAAQILDRIWGRPRQALEHSGAVAVEPTVRVQEPTRGADSADVRGAGRDRSAPARQRRRRLGTANPLTA